MNDLPIPLPRVVVNCSHSGGASKYGPVPSSGYGAYSTLLPTLTTSSSTLCVILFLSVPPMYPFFPVLSTVPTGHLSFAYRSACWPIVSSARAFARSSSAKNAALLSIRFPAIVCLLPSRPLRVGFERYRFAGDVVEPRLISRRILGIV